MNRRTFLGSLVALPAITALPPVSSPPVKWDVIRSTAAMSFNSGDIIKALKRQQEQTAKEMASALDDYLWGVPYSGPPVEMMKFIIRAVPDPGEE